MTGSVKAEKAPKKSWFKGLKSEFKKVVWPDKRRWENRRWQLLSSLRFSVW